MSKADRADWAAQAPWDGIQGKPALVVALGTLSENQLSILLSLIAQIPDNAAFARVAFTGKYSDLEGAPVLASAAFADIAALRSMFLDAAELQFQPLPTAETLQIGSVDFVATQQKYSVAFTTTMSAVPRVQLQVFMADDAGEKLFATITDDSLTEDGFDFWLDSVPALSTGRLEYRAVVETQPA